jgi:outer membrane immunogenic protein
MFVRTRIASAATCSAALLTLGVFGISGPAAAQTSPFQGFYLGGNAGVTWSDSQGNVTVTTTGVPGNGAVQLPSSDVTTIISNAHFDSKHHTGFTGGLELGYNWVMSSGFMVGIETDIDIYDISAQGSNTFQSPVLINPPVTYTLSQNMDTDWLWTLRPRIGYAFDKFLIFASGGLALTTTKYHVDYTDTRTPATAIHAYKEDSKTGYSLGAGAAYAISSHISLKGEYLFEDYGHSGSSASSSDGYLTVTGDLHAKSHLFRAGLDFRF